jgi:GNAT superfamily N-acetyltransferase
LEFRLAEIQDLPEIKSVYKQIIKAMGNDGIQIWDDIYPCDYFEDDIKNKRLYILIKNQKIISAFALCNENRGEKFVKWENNNAKSLYLDRFAVKKIYQKKGIASLMLEKAKQVASNLGAKYLRLFVVDINKPAINFYQKKGFKRVDGRYIEVFGDGFKLREYGYEIKLLEITK